MRYKLSLLVVLLLGGSLLTACSNSRHDTDDPMKVIPVTSSEIEFHDDTRRFWTDQAVWTRAVVSSYLDNSLETPAVKARLLKNQEYIATSLSNYYGQRNALVLRLLLQDQVNNMMDMVAAMQFGETAKQKTAEAKWHNSTRAVSELLAEFNTKYWKEDTIKSSMNEYDDFILKVINAELKRDYTQTVHNTDFAYENMMKFSDMLSGGTMLLLPNRFKK